LKYNVGYLFSATFVVLIFCSCFSSKPVNYFSNGSLDTLSLQQISIPEQVIQKGDLLSITIYSDNPEATSIFNQAGGTPAAAAPSAGISKSVTTNVAAPGSGAAGYLVDINGNIRMHAIGVVHVEGLTKEELAKLITDKLNNLGVLTNAYCIIRFNNFKITVLGEVRAPGVFTLPGEKASILEAVGLAGDITDYGLKDQVLLIREINGKRNYTFLNLTDPMVFSSPNFYVRQNDVLVVQSDTRKQTAMDQQTLAYISVGATVVSSIAILISLLK